MSLSKELEMLPLPILPPPLFFSPWVEVEESQEQIASCTRTSKILFLWLPFQMVIRPLQMSRAETKAEEATLWLEQEREIQPSGPLNERFAFNKFVL